MKNFNSLKVLIPLIIIAIAIAYLIRRTVEDDLVPVSTLDDIVWIIKFNENEPPISQPKVYNNNLHIQTKTEILVYNISTGRLNWRSQIPLEEINFGSWPPPILVDQFRIIVPSQRTMISVFGKETGRLIWNTNDPSPDPFVEDMVLEGSKLIVSSYNSNISAYDIVDGNFIWSNTVPSRTELKLFPFEQKIILGTLDTLVLYNATMDRYFSLIT